jgi:hypothetical protein
MGAYSTIYLGELKDVIKQVTIDAIRNAYSNADEERANDCPLKYQLKGIFDMADGLMTRLADDKEE